MKKILFPTDLSDVSVKGGAYTIAIAEKLKAEVLFYHATILDAEEAEKQVKSVVSELSKNSATVKCSYKVDSGFPVSTIVEEAKSYKPGLVAMATHGEDRDEMRGIHLGSSAVAVMEKVDSPVLIIPHESNFHGIQKIVLALDIEKYSEESVKQAVEFAAVFNARLIILYIALSKNKAEKFSESKEMLVKDTNYDNIDFEVREGQFFIDGIQDFVAEEKVDILIMTTYKRNALTGFFDKSKAKKVAYVSEVPVLVLKAK